MFDADIGPDKLTQFSAQALESLSPFGWTALHQLHAFGIHLAILGPWSLPSNVRLFDLPPLPHQRAIRALHPRDNAASSTAASWACSIRAAMGSGATAHSAETLLTGEKVMS